MALNLPTRGSSLRLSPGRSGSDAVPNSVPLGYPRPFFQLRITVQQISVQIFTCLDRFTCLDIQEKTLEGDARKCRAQCTLGSSRGNEISRSEEPKLPDHLTILLLWQPIVSSYVPKDAMAELTQACCYFFPRCLCSHLWLSESANFFILLKIAENIAVLGRQTMHSAANSRFGSVSCQRSPVSCSPYDRVCSSAGFSLR